MADDLDARVYRYVAEYGPTTAAVIDHGLGEDAERVSETMARLLDTHFVIVAGVNADDEPLYDVAADDDA